MVTHTHIHTHTHTYTHTYTHDNYYNLRCAHAHRGLIIALCAYYVLINAVLNYALHSNNCAHGLKSQFAIITCSHLKPVLWYTQYRARARFREHNNKMQKLILNYTRLHEHTHLRKYAYQIKISLPWFYRMTVGNVVKMNT